MRCLYMLVVQPVMERRIALAGSRMVMEQFYHLHKNQQGHQKEGQ